MREEGRVYQLVAVWLAQHVAGTKRVTQDHVAIPAKISRLSSLTWLGCTPVALGIAKLVRMTRHEETKEIVRSLIEPLTQGMVNLTDAVMLPSSSSVIWPRGPHRRISVA